jgi:hypothetical protein
MLPKRNKLIASTVACCALMQPAHAELYELIQGLGSVLGAEQACGFTYNQNAIKAFIDKAAPADSLSFASNVSNTSTMTAMQIGSMSVSEKTAFCRSIHNTAQRYGFLSSK